MKKEGSKHNKYFFLVLLLSVGILSFIVVKPFLTALISGAILAYVFYPLYKFLQKKIKTKRGAAIIIIILMVLLITIPPIFILNHLTQEVYSLYYSAKTHLETTPKYKDTNKPLYDAMSSLESIWQQEKTKNYVTNLLKETTMFITTKVSNIILKLPQILLQILVAIFTAYFLLKDGKDLMKRTLKATPLAPKHREQILKQFGSVIYAVIFGSLIVALIQGFLGMLGFFIFGVSGAVWWGIVMAFFALIPFIGTWIVWLPAGLILIANGYINATPSLIWKGIGLLIYGLFVISSIDNILKPLIVSGKGRVHPILALVGVIGGLFVFGLIGVVIGPIILGLFQTLILIFEKEKILKQKG
ncbi:hypothetical protein DRJ22_02360 [Candidatus Woesearchaeota archaeon]|nr:MAG: hypothetical protein DRJ22_02360 [Candidatus Woesearchaeota archaeon]